MYEGLYINLSGLTIKTVILKNMSWDPKCLCFSSLLLVGPKGQRTTQNDVLLSVNCGFPFSVNGIRRSGMRTPTGWQELTPSSLLGGPGRQKRKKDQALRIFPFQSQKDTAMNNFMSSMCNCEFWCGLTTGKFGNTKGKLPGWLWRNPTFNEAGGEEDQ